MTTTLYRQVLIETAEQANALPIGTIAKDGDLSVAVKAEDGHWARTDVADGLPMMSDRSMVGWTALVAVEAEEETHSVQTRGQKCFAWRTRLVTSWEASAPSPERQGDCA
ncbi:hypothetical protein [Brachybacterium squillarum]|uniref:hypothetical protein n=1 Tax=Brachybacterium squillarum TaxID=661979 RepID=UPI00222399AE|nr:hypothetical protein [Brachybacterium squillarum]MCW1805291.1 hypothetical protein [Brachybacterium squillarum]